MKKFFLAALFAACTGPLGAADPPKTAFALVQGGGRPPTSAATRPRS